MSKRRIYLKMKPLSEARELFLATVPEEGTVPAERLPISL